MKPLSILLLLLLLFSNCSATRLKESWKHPEYKTLNQNNNVLIVGVTPDTEVRKAFEEQLKNELYNRNIKALQSHIVFENVFKDSKQTEKEIESQIDKLLSNGYDTILVSVTKGVDEKTAYISENPKTDYSLEKFKTYYFLNQDVYFNYDNYSSYKVYRIETSIYNIKKENKKSLIWVGLYDIIDPTDTKKSINNYVKSVIKTLEKQALIPKKE